MIKKTLILPLLVAIGLGILTACGLLSPETSFAPTHPEALGEGRPMCSTCHGDESIKSTAKPFASFDHTPAFVKDHKAQATQDSGTCAACHAQSFCTDCHGGKVPMMPSTKLSDRPDRIAPHREGYLALHRMDGKVDPTSCYKCHGRANNEKCAACHR